MHDEEVTITPQWSTDALSRYFDPTGPYGPIIKAANLPASFVIIQRINLGLMAILGDLRATANFRRHRQRAVALGRRPPVDRDGQGRGRLAGDRAPCANRADGPAARSGGSLPCVGGRRAGRCAGEAASAAVSRRDRGAAHRARRRRPRRLRRGRMEPDEPLRLSKHRCDRAAAVPTPGAERRPGHGRRRRRRVGGRRRSQAGHAVTPSTASPSTRRWRSSTALGDSTVADHLADLGPAAERVTSDAAAAHRPAGAVVGRESTPAGGPASRTRSGWHWPAAPSPWRGGSTCCWAARPPAGPG